MIEIVSEQIISRSGRKILIDRRQEQIGRVIISADAVTNFGAQLFEHEIAKKAGLKWAGYGSYVLVGENELAFGMAYKLPFFGREKALQRLRKAAKESM